MIKRISLVLDLLKRIYLTFNGRLKKKFWMVFIVILLGGGLETISVSMLLPLANNLLNSKEVASQFDFTIVQYIAAFFGKNYLIIMAIVISIVFIFKNMFLVFSSFLQAKFTAEVRKDVSRKMLTGYLKHNYAYFVEENSTNMLRGLTVDIDAFISTLANYFDIGVRAVNIILLMLFMAFSNFKLTIFVVAIAINLILIITLGLKKPMKKYGERVRYAHAITLNVASKTISGIKEVKVLHKEPFFIDSYSDAIKLRGQAETSYKTLVSCPERIIETVFVIGIIIGTVLINGVIEIDMLPSIAVFAVAMMKVLPYISQLSGCLSNVVYNYPSASAATETVEIGVKVENSLQQNYCKSFDFISFEDTIKFMNITFEYNNGHKIIENVSFEIKKGEAIAFIGSSGAGKTTLADIILGLQTLSCGQVYIDNKEVKLDENTWNGLFGYVSQDVYLMDDSIKHNIAFGVAEENIDERRVYDVINQVQLYNLISDLPYGIDSNVGELGGKLSGGQRQRIAIARALYMNPEVLVLDEATSALDNETESAVMEAINRLQGEKTLIIIAHRLSTVKNCDHIYEVKDKKLIEIDKKSLFT